MKKTKRKLQEELNEEKEKNNQLKERIDVQYLHRLERTILNLNILLGTKKLHIIQLNLTINKLKEKLNNEKNKSNP